MFCQLYVISERKQFGWEKACVGFLKWQDSDTASPTLKPLFLKEFFFCSSEPPPPPPKCSEKNKHNCNHNNTETGLIITHKHAFWCTKWTPYSPNLRPVHHWDAQGLNCYGLRSNFTTVQHIRTLIGASQHLEHRKSMSKSHVNNRERRHQCSGCLTDLHQWRTKQSDHAEEKASNCWWGRQVGKRTRKLYSPKEDEWWYKHTSAFHIKSSSGKRRKIDNKRRKKEVEKRTDKKEATKLYWV